MWYKVVTSHNDGRLSSACVNVNFPQKYRTFYSIGEWTNPSVNGTRLFCFKTLKDAKAFTIGSLSDWHIYKCEVKSPAKVKYISRIQKIEEFWKRKFCKKKIRDLRAMTPRNTYSCSAIKLLERVY